MKGRSCRICPHPHPRRRFPCDVVVAAVVIAATAGDDDDDFHPLNASLHLNPPLLKSSILSINLISLYPRPHLVDSRLSPHSPLPTPVNPPLPHFVVTISLFYLH